MPRLKLSDAKARLAKAFKRFPVSTALLFTLVVFAATVFAKERNDLTEYKACVVIWYLSTAAFLSVATKLWREERPGNGIRAIAVHALPLISLVYFLASPSGPGNTIAMGMISLCVLVACVHSSFSTEKDDVAVVSFAVRMVVAGIAAAFVTFAFMIAVFLLYSVLEELFNVHATEYCFMMTAIASWAIVFPTLLFQSVPEGEAKRDKSGKPGKFINGVTRYLLIPVMAAYILLLYAYLAKILVTWSLPDGWVAIPVSVSMAGTLLVVFLLYPSREKGNPDKAAEITAKWMPVLMLPLLALMSVGIIKRIGDYGLTIERLYVAAFNIWCYAVSVTLIINKGRRVNWIPLSFALAALLISIGPWDVSSVTRRSLGNEVRKTLAAQGVKSFPVDIDTYEAFLDKADVKDAGKVRDKLEYLYRTFGGSGIRKVLAADDDTMERLLGLSVTNTLDFSSSTAADIPEGVSNVASISGGTVTFNEARDSLTFNISDSALPRDYAFAASVEELRAAGDKLTLRDGEACLALKDFRITYGRNNDDNLVYCYFSGLVFF